MTLKFNNFKKKLGRKKYLELNFEQDSGALLAIVDDNKINLQLLKEVFNNNEKYEGEVTIDGVNIIEDKDSYPYLENQIGFYDLFTVEQNFKKLLKLSAVKYNLEDLKKYFSLLKLQGNEKYINLSKVNKENVRLLFSYLVSRKLFLLDLTDERLSSSTATFYLNLIEDFLKDDSDRIFIIFAEHLNEFTNLCDSALVIADNKQVYFGDAVSLNVVKDLIIIELASFVEENFYRDLYVDFKLLNNNIIIKKSDLEDVLYYLVKENIDVIKIEDFNQNTKLYEGDE